MRKEIPLNPETGRPDINLIDWQPGDYAGPLVGYTGSRPAVFFKLPIPDDHPDAGIRHILCDGGDGHTIVEEEDGSLTVSPSILAVRAHNDSSVPTPWHGYLERGVWREC